MTAAAPTVKPPLPLVCFDGGNIVPINDLIDALAPGIISFQGRRTGGSRWVGNRQFIPIPATAVTGLRPHDPQDRTRQNYPAFKMPDGSVPVLEATVVLHSREHPDWSNMTIGIPLEEQWECIGTGTPFVFNGTLCLSYGLHTTRVYPREKTALPEQWDYLKQNLRSGEFKRAALRGAPAGSTYAVSEDGVAEFRKTGVLFHP